MEIRPKIDVSPLWKEADRRKINAVGVAMRSGISANTVRRVYNGESVSVVTLEAVADVLGFRLVLERKVSP